MLRVLEPEIMDRPDDARDYDSMDHTEVNRRFVDDLLLAAGAMGELEILDLGAGTARIPIELCRRVPDVRVLAVDASASMLDVARIHIELSGLMSRIMLDRTDAKELPFDDERFAVVMSNSIVHHIPQPRDMLAEAVRVCVGQGLLFVRDLLRPPNSAALDLLVTTYAGDEDERARQMFRQSLAAALSLDEMRDIARQLGFAADSVQVTSDRHWTWQARK
jgi:ubiquinone/menaquinone biosynthesis C-methylase UbiE